jgi:hypothetical protein
LSQQREKSSSYAADMEHQRHTIATLESSVQSMTERNVQLTTLLQNKEEEYLKSIDSEISKGETLKFNYNELFFSFSEQRARLESLKEQQMLITSNNSELMKLKSELEQNLLKGASY